MPERQLSVTRRIFLSGAALVASASGGALITKQLQRVTDPLPIQFVARASGELTRIAALLDTSALVSRDQNLSEALREALTGTWNAPALGIRLPTSGSVVAFLAGEDRSLVRGVGREHDPVRIALATGHLMQRTVDHLMAESLAVHGIAEAEWPIAQLHQDAEIVRGLFRQPPSSVEEAQDLFASLDQRLRIKIHTFRPDESDQRVWIDRLIAWDAQEAERFDVLADLVARPDPVARRQYLEAIDFFDPVDPLIRRARDGGQGRQAGPPSLGPEKACLYARTLMSCYCIARSVGDFLDERSGAAQLTRELEEILYSRVHRSPGP